MNIKSARAKSVRTLPLICWKISLGFGLVMIPLYFMLRLWFPNQLNPQKTTRYATHVRNSICNNMQGLARIPMVQNRRTTLKFRETQLEDINCEDKKEQIEELIIKEQQPNPSDSV